MRWLLAISMPCGAPDGPLSSLSSTESDIAHFGGPDFHVHVNHFDLDRERAERLYGARRASCLSASAAAAPHVHLSYVPGYMTLFWKHVLVPSYTRRFDVIALKDADLLPSMQMDPSPTPMGPHIP